MCLGLKPLTSVRHEYQTARPKRVKWCVEAFTIRVLTHQKPPRRFRMLFFDVLPFMTLPVSVKDKTSKKSVQNDAVVFGVSRPLV